MKIKLGSIESVGQGDDWELYITIKCDDQAKILLTDYFTKISEMVPK
jgi:hypothetical protein